MRKVLFHYHLFKNAGTSLDETLKLNFKGDQWVTKEFPNHLQKNRQQVQEWISEASKAVCFSSHTAYFPVPELPGTKVLPIIFFRHPLDRIVSAYNFERKQQAKTFGAVLAKHTNLRGYIEARLALGMDRQCRNFHTDRFASMYPPNISNQLERAKLAIAQLPFVGSVSHYSHSLINLEEYLKSEGFDQIKLTAFEKNQSQQPMSIDHKMALLQEEVGPECYQQLLEANEDDLSLYEYFLTAYDYGKA